MGEIPGAIWRIMVHLPGSDHAGRRILLERRYVLLEGWCAGLERREVWIRCRQLSWRLLGWYVSLECWDMLIESWHLGRMLLRRRIGVRVWDAGIADTNFFASAERWVAIDLWVWARVSGIAC